jgi:hypothetical protein
MTLAEAISTVAVAGCRLVPDHTGGVSLVVPDGTTIPRAVLEVLRAHREQLAAAHATPTVTPGPAAAAAGDLREYLREKGIAEAAADLVVHATRVFNVPGQAITIEHAELEPEPVFFEPGVPILTTIDTEWHAPGRGYFTVPAGTLGLAIPQRWAIADADARHEVEAAIDHAKQQHKPVHVAVWLADGVRALDLTAFTFEGAVAPSGLDLMPWRLPRGAAAA